MFSFMGAIGHCNSACFDTCSQQMRTENKEELFIANDLHKAGIYIKYYTHTLSKFSFNISLLREQRDPGGLR